MEIPDFPLLLRTAQEGRKLPCEGYPVIPDTEKEAGKKAIYRVCGGNGKNLFPSFFEHNTPLGTLIV